MIARLIYGIPVIGWILREAAEGPASTKALFLVNWVMLWLLAILVFGYPAIIIPALGLVLTMFVVIIVNTRG